MQSSVRKLETCGVDTIPSFEKIVHIFKEKIEMALNSAAQNVLSGSVAPASPGNKRGMQILGP